MKTGHTALAGWCQVGFARRDGTGIYAVVLGSRTRAGRNRDLALLLDWGFDQHTRVRVVEPGRTYATAEIPFSEERLALVPEEDAHAVVLDGRMVVEEVVAPAVVELPVREGQELGHVRVSVGDRVVARRALVAARDVGRARVRREGRVVR